MNIGWPRWAWVDKDRITIEYGLVGRASTGEGRPAGAWRIWLPMFIVWRRCRRSRHFNAGIRNIE